MLSKSEVLEDAERAFTKLHAGAERRGEVRAIDQGELNLREMNCVQKHDGSWVCNLPHIHLPLTNLTYEFVYTVKEDLRTAKYSCKPIEPR
jgi:hypothetical protein